MERIAPVVASGRPVLFEGQMRLAFIREALAAQGIKHARVVLVECDDATRTARFGCSRSWRTKARWGGAGI
jgi:ABC-type nitrate/sulfonate/bicarbonate transport system substrate-binding protein